MKILDLCGKWDARASDGEVFTGTVPGCAHTDLYDTSKLYLDKNSRDCAKLEELEFNYEKSFTIDAEEDRIGAVLVFEGLDTYCDVILNGQKIASCDDMFLTYRLPVEKELRVGENLLSVRFRPAALVTKDLPKRSGAFTTERIYTRRIQCTYGWDWVDRFVTAGIWRPVYLELGDDMRLSDYYLVTESVDAYSAGIRITENFRHYEQGGIVLTEILDGDRVIASKTNYVEEASLTQRFDIPEPKLWYPIPYGDQPLYTVRITVGESVKTEKFGIRTLKILELPDAPGSKEEKLCKKLRETPSGLEYDQNEDSSCFIPIVNGKKIFCTGANWVPSEPFPSAESDEKITKLLTEARNIGINMIRVWGGGIFEKQHFYDECTRLGILVTQDFLMACGHYPEEDAHFCDLLTLEAVEAATKLRNKTSLAWWSGDNENAVGGWDEKPDYHGRIAARRVIAPVLERLDPNRPFLFSSPYGGHKYASKTKGTTHNTQFLSSTFAYMEKEDLSDYLAYFDGLAARFIAEEPTMGLVMPSSLKRFLSPENLYSEEHLLYHTKTNPALKRELYDMISDFCEKLLGAYENPEDAAFKRRYLQYEWIRFTLENARKNLFFNSGIVYWMLDDCWPAAMGWSLLDYYTEKKAGAYAIRAFGKPCSLILEQNAAILSNILPERKEGRLVLRMIGEDGKSVSTLLDTSVSLQPGRNELPLLLSIGKGDLLLGELTVGGECVRTFRKAGCPVIVPCNDLTVEQNGNALTLTAGDRYIHAVEIDGAECADNYFSLLPGEKRTVTLSGAEDVSVIAYTLAT